MKKLLSLVCLSVFMLSVKAYAQSNTTWTIKDKVEKGYFKTNTVFNSHISGFSNKAQADALIQKIKAMPDVASVTTSNADANGNADVKIVMKETHNKPYYLGMAQTSGIGYIEVNGVKKTPIQWAEAAKQRK